MAFQWFYRESRTPPLHGRSLADFFPAKVDGWKVEDLPLGATERERAEAAEVLRLDDMVYRRFTRGPAQFTLFVSYWRRHSMPVRLVAQHTPDICWPAQGWSCTRSNRQFRLSFAGGLSRAGDYRELVALDSRRIATVFWHLADGEVVRDGLEGSTLDWWKRARDRAQEGSPTQYFIRLVTNRNFEELAQEDAWRAVIAKLELLGLREAGGALAH